MEISLFAVGVLTMCIAVVVNICCKKVNIPIVIGYIVTGTIIVYIFDLKTLSSSGKLNEVAEFGIIFLMFVIGLEFSFEKLKTMKQETLLFGSLQLVVCSAIFYAVCHYVAGLDYKTSFTISAAFALSSTAIVLKSFDNQVYSRYQRDSIGILIMQDIAVIPILLIVPTMNMGVDSHIMQILLKIFIGLIIVMLILLVLDKYFASKLLQLAASTNMDEIFVSTILLIVLGASLISQYFGFSHSLGAFIAGMMIAGTEYKHKIKADIEHFKDLFLGFFFITVGMQIDVVFLFKNIIIIFLVLMFVMFIKALAIYVALRLFRSKESSLKVALSLSQIGEFSFVVFLIADTNHILSGNLANSIIPAIANYDINTNDLNQYLTLVAILSMIVTPFILEKIKEISAFILKDKLDSLEVNINPSFIDDKSINSYTNHIVVCGYGVFGKSIVNYLKARHIDYVAIDHNYIRIQEAMENGDKVIYGNIMQKSMLDELNIDKCGAIVVAIDDSYKIRDVCKVLLDKSPNCNIIAKINARAIDHNIDDLDLYAVVDECSEIAMKLTKEAIAARQEKIIKEMDYE